jgi:hypothetical protein
VALVRISSRIHSSTKDPSAYETCKIGGDVFGALKFRKKRWGERRIRGEDGKE